MNMEAVMPTLSEAKRIIEAAITRARELDVNISVAVCDISGRLIALNRMDGALWDVDRGSIGKAIAAAMTGRPSQELSERLIASGRHFAMSNKLAAPQGRRGGLPIIHGGVVEGGCGVSGAHTNEQDEECAHAGITALDVSTLDTPRESVNLQNSMTAGALATPARV
jgi:uncharacterized protein GlcG (DUF336 family)